VVQGLVDVFVKIESEATNVVVNARMMRY